MVTVVTVAAGDIVDEVATDCCVETSPDGIVEMEDSEGEGEVEDAVGGIVEAEG